MRISCLAVVLVAGFVAGCAAVAPPAPLSGAEAQKVTEGVRAFATAVADGVTRRGPTAWSDYFADTPAFFMASEGRVVFESSDAAARGIRELPKMIAHIELTWGAPLRIDPLTSTLAAFGAPYHERRMDPAGLVLEEGGYFTGLAELGPTGWRFRNAHWSVASAPSKVP